MFVIYQKVEIPCGLTTDGWYEYGEWVSKDVLEMDSKEIVCFVTESLKEAYETQKKLQSEFNGDFYTKEI